MKLLFYFLLCVSTLFSKTRSKIYVTDTDKEYISEIQRESDFISDNEESRDTTETNVIEFITPNTEIDQTSLKASIVSENNLEILLDRVKTLTKLLSDSSQKSSSAVKNKFAHEIPITHFDNRYQNTNMETVLFGPKKKHTEMNNYEDSATVLNNIDDEKKSLQLHDRLRHKEMQPTNSKHSKNHRPRYFEKAPEINNEVTHVHRMNPSIKRFPHLSDDIARLSDLRPESFVEKIHAQQYSDNSTHDNNVSPVNKHIEYFKPYLKNSKTLQTSETNNKPYRKLNSTFSKVRSIPSRNERQDREHKRLEKKYDSPKKTILQQPYMTHHNKSFLNRYQNKLHVTKEPNGIKQLNNRGRSKHTIAPHINNKKNVSAHVHNSSTILKYSSNMKNEIFDSWKPETDNNSSILSIETSVELKAMLDILKSAKRRYNSTNNKQKPMNMKQDVIHYSLEENEDKRRNKERAYFNNKRIYMVNKYGNPNNDYSQKYTSWCKECQNEPMSWCGCSRSCTNELKEWAFDDFNRVLPRQRSIAALYRCRFRKFIHDNLWFLRESWKNLIWPLQLQSHDKELKTTTHRPNSWVTGFKDKIPLGAFQGGKTEDFAFSLYVIRAIDPNTKQTLPGMLKDRDTCAKIAYDDGEEGCLPNYEVLTGDTYNWLRVSYYTFHRTPFHPDRVLGGNHNKLYYICRLSLKVGHIITKLDQNRGCFIAKRYRYGFDGREYQKYDYDILID